MTTVHSGAAALIELIDAIHRASESDLDDVVECVDDARDYVEIVALVEAGMRRNFTEAGALHREGFVRALADLLCMVADGAVPCSDWNPIANTEASFLARPQASAALSRLQR